MTESPPEARPIPLLPLSPDEADHREAMEERVLMLAELSVALAELGEGAPVAVLVGIAAYIANSAIKVIEYSGHSREFANLAAAGLAEEMEIQMEPVRPRRKVEIITDPQGRI